LQRSILIEQSKNPQLTKEQILCVLERFRDLDLSIERNRERLVDDLVKCIILYDEKIIITTTFRDEPIEIMTSEEVAAVASLGSDIGMVSPPTKRTFVYRQMFFFCLSKPQAVRNLTGLGQFLI